MKSGDHCIAGPLPSLLSARRWGHRAIREIIAKVFARNDDKFYMSTGGIGQRQR
jgi:hypothetical protein